MLKTLILLPWDPAVSEDVDYVKLEIRESKIRSLKAMEGRHCSPCGWFAIYERNLFGVYIDNDNLFLLLNNNTYYMPEDAEMALHHSIWYGLLRFRGGGKSFEFKYKIFWRTFFCNPLLATMELLLPDDWWYVVCDLPFWIYEQWRENNLKEVLINTLANKRGID